MTAIPKAFVVSQTESRILKVEHTSPGFKTALTRTLNNYGKKNNLFKTMNPSGDDFREGLAGVITVRIPNPQFESQTKIKLTNAEVEGAVNSVVGDVLNRFLEESPSVAKAICQKSLRAAEAREAAKKARDMARSQTKTGSGGLPEKLRDCRNHDLKVSELYLVEGDSAGGSADTGRDSAHQAILPLRGKILNVEKAQLLKVLANTEVTAIFKAIGITPLAEEQDIAKRRYGKIILMTDADVDGSHIRTLLLTFIFRHMRELVKQGCVYVAQPPLYRVLQKSRRNQKPRFVQTHEEMMSELLEIGLEESKLVVHPRPNLLKVKDPDVPSEEMSETREFNTEELRRLAETLSQIVEPLEALERRGVSIRRLAIEQATEEGLLPRFRVTQGSEDHWFGTKTDVEEFLQQQEQAQGRSLKVADEEMEVGEKENTEPKDDFEPDTLNVMDMFEVRTINTVLRTLQSDFRLSLNDFLSPPPRNVEQVFPYEIMNKDNPQKLQNLRELVPKIS